MIITLNSRIYSLRLLPKLRFGVLNIKMYRNVIVTFFQITANRNLETEPNRTAMHQRLNRTEPLEGKPNRTVTDNRTVKHGYGSVCRSLESSSSAKKKRTIPAEPADLNSTESTVDVDN